MIGVLFQAISPSANCISIPLHKDGRAVGISKDCPGDTEGDAGCCSYSFCCHFAGVLNSTDLSLSLVANGFLMLPWNPLPLYLPISPFEQPPRD